MGRNISRYMVALIQFSGKIYRTYAPEASLLVYLSLEAKAGQKGKIGLRGGGLVRHLCYSTTLEQTSGRCSAAAPRPPHRRKERLKFLLSFVCYMSRGVFSKSATSVKKPIPHFSMFPQSFPPSKSRISLILVPHRNASLWEVGSKIEHGISHVDQGKRHRIDGDVQNTNFKAKTRQFRP